MPAFTRRVPRHHVDIPWATLFNRDALRQPPPLRHTVSTRFSFLLPPALSFFTPIAAPRGCAAESYIPFIGRMPSARAHPSSGFMNRVSRSRISTSSSSPLPGFVVVEQVSRTPARAYDAAHVFHELGKRKVSRGRLPSALIASRGNRAVPRVA